MLFLVEELIRTRPTYHRLDERVTAQRLVGGGRQRKALQRFEFGGTFNVFSTHRDLRCATKLFGGFGSKREHVRRGGGNDIGKFEPPPGLAQCIVLYHHTSISAQRRALYLPLETIADRGPHPPSKLDEEGSGARWLFEDSRPILATNIDDDRDDWESRCVSLLTMQAMVRKAYVVRIWCWVNVLSRKGFTNVSKPLQSGRLPEEARGPPDGHVTLEASADKTLQTQIYIDFD